jgi:diguanylate cyclase (GGDEF)-like protein
MITAYFFSRRYAIVTVIYMALTFGVVITFWADTPVKAVIYVAVVSTTALIAAVVVIMREHQARLVDQLYSASTTDWLTGLLNRRAFESAFARELQRAARSELALSLVCFDLDHFKECNDQYGHAAGDLVLQRFAALVQLRCQPGDLVARVGGEEFAIVLFDTAASDAADAVNAFGRELIETDVPGEPSIRFSAGIASPIGDVEPGEVMLAADRALYAAKRSGRERVARWDGGHVCLGPVRYGAALPAAA